MKLEPAVIMVIEIGSLFVFFLLIPLLVVLGRVRGVWRSNRGVGLLLTGIIGSTGFLFVLLFAAFVALVVSGAP